MHIQRGTCQVCASQQRLHVLLVQVRLLETLYGKKALTPAKGIGGARATRQSLQEIPLCSRVGDMASWLDALSHLTRLRARWCAWVGDVCGRFTWELYVRALRGRFTCLALTLLPWMGWLQMGEDKTDWLLMVWCVLMYCFSLCQVRSCRQYPIKRSQADGIRLL